MSRVTDGGVAFVLTLAGALAVLPPTTSQAATAARAPGWRLTPLPDLP